MANELPTGTVTFLFTDVEGSTRLLEELGAERYSEALGEHRAIVRDALAAHGGAEVDTQGDAFFCAFRSARSAVACAADIGEALRRTPIRVRVGIHTGEALLADGHYVGMDVHRAARIGGCGHGGQVVISPATVALLEPDAFLLTDLGEHRLKDLSAPVRIHQLGEERFPPLKALFRTNLPVPATPFLGREAELRDLVERGSEAGVRILTLTGPGGTGKTRLALQAAAELSGSFPDGIWWVPLASLREGAQVASALASVLDVEEEVGRELGASIAEVLRGKRALVLLDNCEHLVDAAAGLAASLVAGCPEMLLLATSREALAVTGEHVYPVQPLVGTDAVDLFFARARSVGAELDADESRESVSALCGRLDNLPLAVELAAARAAALPPAALLDRLSSGIGVLKGPRDMEERQRTLRATIAWSYGLLEATEQELFRRLAAFVGGGSLSAIEEVCNAHLDDLLSLVAKSLVRQTPVEGNEPRYWLLETIREFAFDELAASGERGAVEERHTEFFGRFAAEAHRGLVGPASGAWHARVERDLANLRAAFAHAAEAGHRDSGVTLATALWISHFDGGRYSESEEVVRRALELAPEGLERALLRELLGRSYRLQRRPGHALEEYAAAEEILAAIADRGDEWWDRSIEIQLAKATLFYFENRQDELVALARELEPIIEGHGSPMQKLDFLHLRCQQAYRLERYAPSEETEVLVRETYRRALELDDVGADFMLGFCLLWRGKLEEAEKHFELGRETARSRGVALIETRCLVYGSIARRRRSEVEGTRSWIGVLDAQDELHGYQGLTAANAAWVAFHDGDLDEAKVRGDEAFADWHAGDVHGSPFEWTARFPLLGVALARGEIEAAVEHARALLDESLQPLPAHIAAAVEQAVSAGDAASLTHALEVAQRDGYA